MFIKWNTYGMWIPWHNSRSKSDNDSLHLCQKALWINLAALGSVSLFSSERESKRQIEKEWCVCSLVCMFGVGVDSCKIDYILWASVWQWKTPNQRTSPHSASCYWSRFNRPSKESLIWTTSFLISSQHKSQCFM